ncbi:hypothetical protein DID88_006135 [Monilinia fructigena]|uniref:GPI anchored protein n=1 Tax=Monilinia fructigena TaxID=38457 RepID=A0A395J1T2_9HELO|nr:hypothetical protein DID88_006135 [Monilinia fructigena]
MHASLITIFAAALMGTAVAAQDDSVVDLFLVGIEYDAEDQDQAPFVGSIIASDATATTYSITCGTTTAASATSSSSLDFDDDCGIPESFTFTQGPSTIQYIYTFKDYYDDVATSNMDSASSLQPYFSTVSIGCVLAGSSSAYCTAASMESAATTTYDSAETTTVTGQDLSTLLAAIPVTITAGASSTSDSVAKTTSGASATSSAASSASASSKSTATGSSSVSGSVASTGGMPMVTAKAQWVMGGAAAAMVMAAL